jgi:hypothetical protein
VPWIHGSKEWICGAIVKLCYCVAENKTLIYFSSHPKKMEKLFNDYIEFEHTFIPYEYYSFFKGNWQIPFGSVAAYLVMCYMGPMIMKNSKPFDLRWPLVFWNLFLATFSVIGAIKTVPELLTRISTNTFEESICLNGIDTWGSSVSGLWVMLFCASKIPELLDTVFIVLRKKPLIFLHWYHHVTVLLFCWDAYSSLTASGLYFVAMNYTVHAVMYTYYFGQALRVVPKWFPAYIITIMQILQMIVGTIVCAATWYYKFQPQGCFLTESNMMAGAVMYASYLALFVQFALKRFIFTGASKTKKN